MGFLNFDVESWHLIHIKKILSRRGLQPDLNECWEIHGPHGPDFNYQVYVGYAFPKDGKCQGGHRGGNCNLPWDKCENSTHISYHCVVIYPKAVYEIESLEEWGKPEPENRIYVIEKGRR
jgi:hypothetical protein